MATTNAQIRINSSDLTGDVLALDQQTSLKKAGVSTGLDQTTGVGRKTTTSTSEYVLCDADDYTAARAHKLYIRVVSANATEYATLNLGSTAMGRLYGGDWCFIPWQAQSDIKITPSVATEFSIEYLLIFEA